MGSSFPSSPSASPSVEPLPWECVAGGGLGPVIHSLLRLMMESLCSLPGRRQGATLGIEPLRLCEPQESQLLGVEAEK